MKIIVCDRALLQADNLLEVDQPVGAIREPPLREIYLSHQKRPYGSYPFHRQHSDRRSLITN